MLVILVSLTYLNVVNISIETNSVQLESLFLVTEPLPRALPVRPSDAHWKDHRIPDFTFIIPSVHSNLQSQEVN